MGSVYRSGRAVLYGRPARLSPLSEDARRIVLGCCLWSVGFWFWGRVDWVCCLGVFVFGGFVFWRSTLRVIDGDGSDGVLVDAFGSC